MTDWLADDLDGEHAHRRSSKVFDKLPLEAAGRRLPGLPYTIWQLLRHMIWWQDFWLARLAGDRPQNPPNLAVTWDTGEAPADEAMLSGAVLHFQGGVTRAQGYTSRDLHEHVEADPPGTLGSELVQLATHNSYHAGQVVLIRRLLGCWPPPR